MMPSPPQHPSAIAVRHSLPQPISFLRLFLFILPIIFTSVRSRAQESVCGDPVEKPCFDCLTQIAQYTSGMVIANRAGASARLQSAIDNAYKDAQNEWTGRLRERTWIRAAYFTGIGALLLFAVIVTLIHKFLRPRLWPNRPPSWTTEKILLILTLCALTLAVVVERWSTWDGMNASYEKLAAAVQPFVHLHAPAAVANTEASPCAQYWSERDPMLQQCQEDWKRAAGRSPVRYKESHFTSPELLGDLTAVATACRGVSLPAWWTNPNTDPGRHVVGSRCVLLENGTDSVTFQDIASLPTLPKWLDSTAATNASLELEPLFRRTNTAGGNVYQTKVRQLLGSDGFRYYKDNFKWQSAFYCGLPLLAMWAYAVFIIAGRHRELVNGSVAWAHALRTVSRWLLATDVGILLIVIMMAVFG